YPIWLLMRRPTTDVNLGGIPLTAGTELIISPHALHHDARYFPNPDHFDPDRWSPEHAHHIPRAAYLPFAAGPHQCIGSAFALAQTPVVAATVLPRTLLPPVPDAPVGTKLANIAVPDHLVMTVTPRTTTPTQPNT